MGNVKSEVTIENENLFRALVCAPIAILFAVFAVNSLMSSGIVLFKLIFVCLALYFSLSTLAYAAYYTNEYLAEKAENKNLLSALLCAPIAISFAWYAANSVISSGHIFFQIIFVLMALYFTLRALAHAAYYTNDYHAEKAGYAG